MAVLKDLIVHGPSRFLNGAKFNTINAESIGAEQGIFNKLIATTLDAKEATIDNLTAQNATVVGLLDVQGELHTNAWTNANIANIGGSFYISPTVEPTDGTTTISITRNSATSWTVSASGTFATDFIKSGTATSGVAWPANSLVLITGDVVVGNMVYPLGTLKGTLNSQVTATAATTSKTITITGVTDAQNNNSPSVLQELYELNGNANISNATYKNGKISLYKLGSNPIGILLSSMGSNSNSIIDIYGGVSTNPTVRIGHLAGLPNINGSAPTGWGIYTDNGYFKGTIVANTGEIGRFTIANDLYSGQLGGDDSVCISIGTQQTAQIGGVATPINNWAFTAGNKFGVTADGDLYASNATISGTLTITNKNSNVLTKEEAEALANTTQNMTQESIEDILKVVDMTSWIAKYGDCEPTSDTEAIKGKLYFDVNKQQVIPMVNPHLQNYYELNNSTWTETEDTIVDINKQYFERNGESNYYYTPIKPVGNENPSEEQWYELSNDTYQLSSDNDLVNNKLYFLQITDGIDTYYQVITEYIPNPYALGLYELNSINKSISSYINTHVRLDNGAIIIQADNTEASISISLNDGILLKDDNGTPIASFSDTIVLGNRSEMHLELSPGDSSNNILPELGFYDGYTKVAYVNSDTLNINRGEIKEKLRIGQFEWRTQGANRISLIYTPISS